MHSAESEAVGVDNMKETSAALEVEGFKVEGERLPRHLSQPITAEYLVGGVARLEVKGWEPQAWGAERFSSSDTRVEIRTQKPLCTQCPCKVSASCGLILREPGFAPQCLSSPPVDRVRMTFQVISL